MPSLYELHILFNISDHVAALRQANAWRLQPRLFVFSTIIERTLAADKRLHFHQDVPAATEVRNSIKSVVKKLMAEKQNIIVTQHASNMPRIGGSSCSTDTQQETTAKHQLHNEGEQNVRILRPRSELPAGSDKEDECHRLAHGY
jgi:hypothetical protein